MDDRAVAVIVGLARRLPESDIKALAAATAGGAPRLEQLRSDVASSAMRTAVDALLRVCASTEAAEVKAALLAAADMHRRDERERSLDVVWTGPPSGRRTSRLTSAVVSDLIGEARRELLLVGYAVQSHPEVTRAMGAAIDAGVEATLLLERSIDNPGYSGPPTPLADVKARRLAWPAAMRPAGGAALHAKILVADRRTVLIGSANITAWALERNLECGLLVRDRRVGESVHEHIDALLMSHVLIEVR